MNSMENNKNPKFFYGWGIVVVALISMALITYTILAPLAGHLIDRFGPRKVIVPGVIVLSVGLVHYSMIQS